MVLEFKIIKLFDHHNRGQAIAAQHLNFEGPVEIKEGALLNGIPVYHYLEMYPIAKDEKEPKFDIYVFRPLELSRYPNDYFSEGQVVKLFQIDHLNTVLSILENDIQELIQKLFEMARNITWNKISGNYKFILTEVGEGSKNINEQRKINKKHNDKKKPLTLAELSPALKKLYINIYDINLQIYRATNNMTIIDFHYYLKSSLDKEYRLKVFTNPPMLHCKVSMPPWLSDQNEKFNINWEHNQWQITWKSFLLGQKLKHS